MRAIRDGDARSKKMRTAGYARCLGASADTTPIILITGAFGTAFDWPESLVGALARARPVIIPDPRDNGRNEWNVPHGYLIDDMASDVTHLMDAKRIRRAHILGASMGGSIAQSLAIDHSERVASLTLLMSTSGRGVWDDAQASPSARVLEAFEKEMGLYRSDRIVEGLIHRYTTMAFPETLDAREARRRAQRVAEHGFNRHAAHGEAFRRSPPRLGHLASVVAPTLIVHGREDELFPASHARLIHSAMPSSRLRLVKTMGHHLSEARGARIARLVRAHARRADVRDRRHAPV